MWGNMPITYSFIGHTDDSGIAADHEEDEAEERHVPSAKQRHETMKNKMCKGNQNTSDAVLFVI